MMAFRYIKNYAANFHIGPPLINSNLRILVKYSDLSSGTPAFFSYTNYTQKKRPTNGSFFIFA